MGNVGTPSVPRAPAPVSQARAPVPGNALSRIDPSTVALATIARTSRARDFDTMAHTFCSSLARALRASQVSLGWRDGDRMRIVASDPHGAREDEGDTRQALAAAMDEALDQQRPVFSLDRDLQAVRTAHRALATISGARALLGVPIGMEGRPLGAVMIAWAASDERPIDQTLAAASALVQATLPAVTRLLLLQRAIQSPLWSGDRRRSVQPIEHSRRRQRLGLAAVAILALLLWPFEQSLNVPVRIEGGMQRIAAAPADGYLKSVEARAGDRVAAGQVLAQLGERDLELEHARLVGETGQYQAQADAAMARGQRGEMAVAQSRLAQTRARLALIELRLDQLRVRAPIDGVVIDGDLRDRVGAPVDRGENLFVVAPSDRWRAVVELDERDLRAARVGASGTLSLDALPDHEATLRIERIAPSATVLDGRNVVELQAAIDHAIEDLRPGMRGVAHLDAGRSNLLARFTTRVAGTLQRIWWRWRPW